MSKLNILLKKSLKKDKKYTVIITDKHGKKTIHFGANGYSDYTKHKDKQRMYRYILRHRRNENWNKRGIKTAGWWSRWLLWNKPTIKESIRDIEERFNVKINRR